MRRRELLRRPKLSDSVHKVVTEVFGIQGEDRNDEFWFLCPNPEHPDSDPSCSINLDSGLWHCFSCGMSGNLITLGELALKRPRGEIAGLLEPENPDARLARLQRHLEGLCELERQTQQATPNIPVPFLDAYPPGPLDYMHERGFNDETLADYQVRFVAEDTIPTKKGEATILHSIAMPVLLDEPEPIAWCYRKTERSLDWQPRYLYTTGVPLQDHWFGWHLMTDRTDVVIVEGPLDAMWVHQTGFPVLAMMGTSHLNPHKVSKLERFRSATIFADRDTAGALATHKLGSMIFDRLPCRVATYGSWTKGTDPQELPPIDVELAIERAVPWTIWRAGQSRRH